MATDQNIQDALTFATRSDNLLVAVGKTIGSSELTRCKDALKALYAYNSAGDPWPAGRPDADDIAAWLWKQASACVTSLERKEDESALTPPAEWSSA